MGFLTKLVTFPISGPLWVVQQLTEEAERRLYDEDAIRAQLTALEIAHEDGQITEDELDDAEDVLLDRLREARARRGEQLQRWIPASDADE
jgi:hypothetical protein